MTAKSGDRVGGGTKLGTATVPVVVPGLSSNSVTDNGPAIQAVLDSIAVSGGTAVGSQSYDVLVQLPGSASIFVNSTVQVKSDHTTLRFGSPVVFGATGRIRLNGELVETPTSSSARPKLAVDAAEGATQITLTSASIFAVGDYIVIRGARDATGAASGEQKQECSIESISGNTLTLNEELGDPFLAYNANPLAPAGTTHLTEVTKVTASTITSAANRDDRTVTVASTAAFAAGDYVQVLDAAHTTKPDGTIETTNYRHREVALVTAVVSSTVLRLSHGLHHTYDLTQRARVAKMSPVKHSHVKDASVTWNAMSTVGNAFEIKYGVNCSIARCEIRGDGARTMSWKSQAFRMTDSYLSMVDNCYAATPAVTTSGRGYGATIYGSTACQVRDSKFLSLRHSVLLFNGASSNRVQGVHSEDCAISDLDIHGAECRDNLFSDCVVIGGDAAADDGSVNKTACKAGNTTHSQGDHGNTFASIKITNYHGAAFEVVPASTNTTFRDCVVNGAYYGLKLVANSANTALVTTDTSVVNCDFMDLATGLLNVNGTSGVSMVRGLVLEGCRFWRPTTGLAVSYAQRVALRRNSFYSPSMASTVYAVQATSVTAFTAKSNDLSGAPRAFKLSGCPSARVSGNTLHDLTEGTVYEDAGGNTGALVSRNEMYGFTAKLAVSGTGPSTGGSVDIGQPYAADTPARHGLLDWNFDPIMSGSASGQAATTGVGYVVKFTPQTSGPLSNVIMTVGSTAPAGALTTGQNFVAVFDSAGAQIAITGDQTTAWATSGVKTMALAAAPVVQAGKDYYAFLLSNSAAGTSAVFVRNNAGAVTTPNVGFASAASYRFATNGSGLTAVPTTLNLASNSGTGAQPWWMAFS